MGGKALTDREYIDSDAWKCVDSPTGAHHWIELQYADGQFSTGLFYCKWCFDTKKLPVNWAEVRPKGVVINLGKVNLSDLI